MGYTIYCTTVDSEKRVEIFDWLPVYGDPDKKTRDRAKKRELKRNEAEALRMMAQAQMMAKEMIHGRRD